MGKYLKQYPQQTFSREIAQLLLVKLRYSLTIVDKPVAVLILYKSTISL